MVGIILLPVMIFTFINVPFGNNGRWQLRGSIHAIDLGIDIRGGVYAIYVTNADNQQQLTHAAVGMQAILQQRGFPLATVVPLGANSLRVEVPDVADPSLILELLGEPARLEFRMPYALGDAVIFDYRQLINATPVIGAGGNYEIAINIRWEGQQAFAAATADLANQSAPNNYIAVWVGDTRISAPTVSTTINSPNFVIQGQFTHDQALRLATTMMAGTLGLELDLVQSSVISATLGENALRLGLIAGIIGMLLVFAFMVLVYRGFGVITIISVLFYFAIVMFLLAVIPGVALTLPGIAGIILGLGMALDAKIIIYERIRDEFKQNKTLRMSTRAGFRKSLSAIIDFNVTSVLSAIVLIVAARMFALGGAAIEGFAIVLLIGIAVSLFSALFITRKLAHMFMAFNRDADKINPESDEFSRKFFGLQRMQEDEDAYISLDDEEAEDADMSGDKPKKLSRRERREQERRLKEVDKEFESDSSEFEAQADDIEFAQQEGELDLLPDELADVDFVEPDQQNSSDEVAEEDKEYSPT